MSVTKETNPGDMFRYLKYLIENFPSHQHKANWHLQSKMGKI